MGIRIKVVALGSRVIEKSFDKALKHPSPLEKKAKVEIKETNSASLLGRLEQCLVGSFELFPSNLAEARKVLSQKW